MQYIKMVDTSNNLLGLFIYNEPLLEENFAEGMVEITESEYNDIMNEMLAQAVTTLNL